MGTNIEVGLMVLYQIVKRSQLVHKENAWKDRPNMWSRTKNNHHLSFKVSVMPLSLDLKAKLISSFRLYQLMPWIKLHTKAVIKKKYAWIMPFKHVFKLIYSLFGIQSESWLGIPF